VTTAGGCAGKVTRRTLTELVLWACVSPHAPKAAQTASAHVMDRQSLIALQTKYRRVDVDRTRSRFADAITESPPPERGRGRRTRARGGAVEDALDLAPDAGKAGGRMTGRRCREGFTRPLVTPMRTRWPLDANITDHGEARPMIAHGRRARA